MEHKARVGHVVVRNHHVHHSDDCATRPIALWTLCVVPFCSKPSEAGLERKIRELRIGLVSNVGRMSFLQVSFILFAKCSARERESPGGSGEGDCLARKRYGSNDETRISISFFKN